MVAPHDPPFGFDGRQLDWGWTLALLYHAGFRGFRLIRAAGVAAGESNRYTAAWHENVKEIVNETTGETEKVVTSIDRGFMQVNSLHDDQLPPAKAMKPIPNAEFAFQLSNGGRNFDAWYAYKNRSAGYREGRKQAAWFFLNGSGWRWRVHLVEEELG